MQNENLSLNNLFINAISTLGYSVEDQKKSIVSFDSRKKVQTITLAYTDEERLLKIKECFFELKERHSFLSLIFLKYSLQNFKVKDKESCTDVKHEDENIYMNNNFLNQLVSENIDVLIFCLNSNNSIFLNCLLEILIFLNLKINLKLVLKKYDFFQKNLILKYLNSNIDRSYLIIKKEEDVCNCNLFLKRILDDVFKFKVINNELDFIINDKINISDFISLSYLKAHEDKFINKSVYKKLVDGFSFNYFNVDFSAEKCKSSESNTLLLEKDKTIRENLKIIQENGKRIRELESIVQKTRINVEFEKARFSFTGNTNVLADSISNIKLSNREDNIKLNTSESIIKDIKSNETIVNGNDKTKIDNNIPNIKTVDNNTIKDIKPNETIVNEQTLKKPSRFGAGRFGQKQVVNSSLITEKSYINIKWKKVPKAQTQIFSSIAVDEIEKLFEIYEFDEFENKKDATTIKKTTNHFKEEQVCCMDPKKSYALNIAMGRLKINNTELITRISEEKFYDENIIKQLIMYFPTDEEIQLINDSNTTLTRAEMLFKEADNLELFHNKLLALRFKFAFKAKDHGFLIKSSSEAFKRIIDSKELRKLFGVLLVIGNVLNSNTFNGKAEGFGIESLDSFSDPKIIKLISKKISKDALMSEIFQNNTILNDSVENLIYEVNDLKKLYVEKCLDNDTKDKYLEILSDFQRMMDYYKELQVMFGESDEKFIKKLEGFINTLE